MLHQEQFVVTVNNVQKPRNRRVHASVDDSTQIKYKEQSVNELMLNLNHVARILVSELQKINADIAQQDTKFILANKPTFDAQKRELFKILTLVEKWDKLGFTRQEKTADMVFQVESDAQLETKTLFAEWNTHAQLANTCIETLNKHIFFGAQAKRLHKRKLSATKDCDMPLLIGKTRATVAHELDSKSTASSWKTCLAYIIVIVCFVGIIVLQ